MKVYVVQLTVITNLPIILLYSLSTLLFQHCLAVGRCRAVSELIPKDSLAVIHTTGAWFYFPTCSSETPQCSACSSDHASQIIHKAFLCGEVCDKDYKRIPLAHTDQSILVG